MSQNPCFEDASRSKPSQSQKTRRALGGLTSGFVGRFCGGFFGPAGGLGGGRVPARMFCFQADFLAIFFLLIFLLHFATYKIQRKNPTTSTADFCKPVESRLKPKQAVSQFSDLADRKTDYALQGQKAGRCIRPRAGWQHQTQCKVGRKTT